MMRGFLAAAAAWALFGAAGAAAQETGTGYVEVCLAGTAHGTAPGTLCPAGSRSWERPADGKAVLSCGTITDPAACIWGAAEMRYRRWQDIGDAELVLTCGSEVPSGVFGSPDPCGSGGHLAGKPNIPKRDVITGGGVTLSGAATLTWVPPSAYADGSPLELSEIDKYTIHWGTQSRVYPNAIDVMGGEAQSAAVDLTLTMPTTFYFAMTATVAGVRSSYSNEATKFVDYVSESRQPAAPMSVTLELSLTCTDSEPGRTCRAVIE